MYTHENAQLSPTVLPDNAAYRTVIYTSSDPDVAAVSENGLVTAVGCGTAKITVRADDGSNTETCCTVTVLPKLVTKLILNTNYIEDTAFINGGNSHQLSVSVYPDDADNTAVTFTSSNPEIVSADASTGLLTLNKPGTAIITCMADDGSFCYIFSSSFYLIPLKILCVVYRDCNFPIVCFYII